MDTGQKVPDPDEHRELPESVTDHEPWPDHPGRWWSRAADGRLVCELCPRHCRLKPGQRGFCYVRRGAADGIVLTTYGRSSGFCIDPIEKKPLNHFYPGTSVLSFGTVGCNLGCQFCQNWDISKVRKAARLQDQATPGAIAAAAARHGCRSVAFTYNDPVIFAEYALDTARACRERGIKTVAVTAGYITPAARGEFFDAFDAANIDLKGFTETFYAKRSLAHLQPVLDTLKYVAHRTRTWLEITTLLIPGENDSDAELRELTAWVKGELGPDVPLHFSAFHPDYRMTGTPPTPPTTLSRARDLARAAGLNFVYTGNVHDPAGGSTWCPGCGALLIERDWYKLGRYGIRGGRCEACLRPVPGHFDDVPGTWGARRQPLDMAAEADL